MTKHSRFLTLPQAEEVRRQFGTPVYVYDERLLREAATLMLNVDVPYGLTIRYAMKANSNRSILKLFDSLGIHIDASSGFEAERAMLCGIAPQKILLTAQELPHNLEALVERGVQFTASSLHQLEVYGQLFPGTAVSVRINPGFGAGAHTKVNVGDAEVSFGIWHEALPQVQELLQRYRLTVKRLHTHIGSGSNPEVWTRVAEEAEKLLVHFPEATILNLGGGFKVPYFEGDTAANMTVIGERFSQILGTFAKRTGRKMHLELEPGKFLVTDAGALLATVQDIASTNLFTFLKTDTGMSEIIRPSYYGSYQTITVLSESEEEVDYVVVGHCCESADLLTPDPEDYDSPKARRLTRAKIGDLLAVDSAGAYCSSMSTINYNSFPQVAEVLLCEDGSFQLIRQRQTMEEMIHREFDV